MNVTVTVPQKQEKWQNMGHWGLMPSAAGPYVFGCCTIGAIGSRLYAFRLLRDGYVKSTATNGLTLMGIKLLEAKRPRRRDT